jgi:hypothetical protein
MTRQTLEGVTEASRALGEGRRDCVVRALALAFDLPYQCVWHALRLRGRRTRCGTHNSTWKPLAEFYAGRALAWYSTANDRRVPKTVRSFEAITKGTYLVRTSGHLLCIRDGKALDWTAGRKHRVVECARIDVPA